MKPRDVIRVAGPLVGAAGFVAAVSLFGGWWGLGAGGVIFLACTSIADLIWRRGASREEIRRDLEDRARDTLP